MSTCARLGNDLDQYAVMGNPIDHSLSPKIHAAFAEQTGDRLSYRAILVEPGGFRRAVEDFFAQGGRGLNITIPFKQEAWGLSRIRRGDAERAGAVNTLYRDGHGRYCGETTDGIGFVRDFTVNLAAPLRDRRVLVLGAGGAVRGVLGPLLRAGPKQVVIANRTLETARQLRQTSADLGAVAVSSFEALAGQCFDVVINGTASSLGGLLPPLPDHLLSEDGICYDMMYRREPTPFIRWGRDHGARLSVDGLGMLVEQAAESFFLWRGVRPNTAPVLKMLRTDH
ncbi:MAG: shikimate dehydrogenase [Gammaproteobacteria bacterium]